MVGNKVLTIALSRLIFDHAIKNSLKHIGSLWNVF